MGEPVDYYGIITAEVSGYEWDLASSGFAEWPDAFIVTYEDGV